MSKTTSNKLFLLDAMALIYRAHFAFSKNPRITSKGLNTGAAFGFTNSLLEIIYKEKPTHIGVAFDTAAPTFRHEVFEKYKANRQEQPEDITQAIPQVMQIIKGFGIPILLLDGYEADDVVGTIAKKAVAQGFEVYMMTPDKDYSQLVEEHVYLYKPAFMGNDVEVLGVKEVLKKWEIKEINQVVDILGLQGDAVDNIPGIPGVGAKTAVKLIEEFGTIETVIKNADSLKGKLKDKVKEFANQALLSKELATINIHVPIEFNQDDLKYTGPTDSLKKIFDELEFRTIKKRVFGEDGSTTTTKTQPSITESEEKEIPEVEHKKKYTIQSIPHHYHIINTPVLQKKLIEFLRVQDEICIDTETTGLDPMTAELVGLSVCYHPHEAYYIPIPAEKEKALEVLQDWKEILEDKNIVKIGQNIKYDQLVLERYGICIQGSFFDTMLAHYLIDPETRHNMDILSEIYLNYIPISIETLIGKKGLTQGTMRDVPLEKIADYAAEDADVTLQLKQALEPILKKDHLEKLFQTVEIPLVSVLATMEKEGVRIDTPVLKDYSIELEKEINHLEKKIYTQTGTEFNISSPKQLGEVLFEKLKLDPNAKKTKTGQYATGEDILSKLAYEHPIVKDILDYRELQKLKNTYIDTLPQLINPTTGRVHTSYNQAVAATGRLSSTNPNLQNIPIRTARGREIRKAFIPRDKHHVLLSADYSQIELRIMASFSKDKTMIQAFKEGRDIHTETASKILKVKLTEVTSEMRRRAKTANFGIIYGISAFGLAQRLSIPRKEAAAIIDAYFQEFPAIKAYMDKTIAAAREKEYVETILGRRRYLRDINSRNMTMRGFAERNTINAPIQGSAADIIKLAMISIHQWINEKQLRSKMILQVHDELVFDVHEEEVELLKKEVKHRMEKAWSLEVPLEVEVGVGKNWLEAH